MSSIQSGPFTIIKMRHALADSGANKRADQPWNLNYWLNEILISDLIGREFKLEFTQKIFCLECGRKTNKSFNQGYCFPCFRKLACCDLCILKPQLCHFSKGTCREPDWAQDNCLQPHFVYLANSSNLKVGITRERKLLERWGDQGAIAGIPFAKVPERKIAGLLEVLVAKGLSDKTDWRALITKAGDKIDFLPHLEAIRQLVSGTEFEQYLLSPKECQERYQEFLYPVRNYLAKAKLHDLEKEPKSTATLEGVRGQYLIFSDRAINMRKYQGYEISLEIS